MTAAQLRAAASLMQAPRKQHHKQSDQLMHRPQAGYGANKLTTHFSAQFTRLGVVLKPTRRAEDREGVINPASARLRDGTLRLYPRMVDADLVSRIGCFRVHEQDGTLAADQSGFALEPEASYEIRNGCDGYGCEDPRVTYIAALKRYVMAYVAYGPRGPEVAVAVSTDGLTWKRLGLVLFKKSKAPFADKDAAFFPEPVISPRGIPSLAFYHRPTLWSLWRKHGRDAVKVLKRSGVEHESIAIGYVPLDAAYKDAFKLCEVSETHQLRLPHASWGDVKVGAGTPPVRIPGGWLAVIHGVDELPHRDGRTQLRYCAGLIIHDATRLERIVYRSPEPLFVPELAAEIRGRVNNVVFPTAIDPRPDLGARVFDIYYGMGDRQTGRGRMTLNE